MSFTVIQRFDKIVHSFFDATKKFPFPAFSPQRHENKLSFFPNILQNELKIFKALFQNFDFWGITKLKAAHALKF